MLYITYIDRKYILANCDKVIYEYLKKTSLDNTRICY